LSTHGAGRVVDPAHRQEVAAEVAELLNEEKACRAMGAAGRRYAERTFSPERAADRFIAVFGDKVAEPVVVPVPAAASASPAAAVALSALAAVTAGVDEGDVESEEPFWVRVAGDLAGVAAQREAS
jgi:hypothetical protein